MVLLSGISFGLVHSVGIAKIISTIIIGIIFAIMYATTKNIVYPIIGHSLMNLISVSMTIFTDMFRDHSHIEDILTYIEARYLIEIKGAIIISLILIIILSVLFYIKRKTIISSDFKDCLIEIFTE